MVVFEVDNDYICHAFLPRTLTMMSNHALADFIGPFSISIAQSSCYLAEATNTLQDMVNVDAERVQLRKQLKNYVIKTKKVRAENMRCHGKVSSFGNAFKGVCRENGGGCCRTN